MAWSRAFQKCIVFSFFGQIFFCKHFYYITGFCEKFNLQIFLQILKIEHKHRHQAWDLEGGGQISWFSSSSRDRVKFQIQKGTFDTKLATRFICVSKVKSDNFRTFNFSEIQVFFLKIGKVKLNYNQRKHFTLDSGLALRDVHLFKGTVRVI